jgi:hypothetical protein
MILTIVNKVLVILLILSSIHTLRSLYYFIQAYVRSTKYLLSKQQLLLLGLSISYIITSILTGIKI